MQINAQKLVEIDTNCNLKEIYMLTKQAKIECQYLLDKINDALKNGQIATEKRNEFIEKRLGLIEAIKEMERLEKECER